MILIPFALLILINLLPRKIRTGFAYWATLAAGGFQCLIAALTPFNVWQGMPRLRLEQVFGFNLQLSSLMAILLLTAGLVGACALLVARFTLKNENEQFNFNNLLLIALIGMNGIALTRDLFTLYVFIEVTALATFVLINLFRRKESYEAIWKYLIMSVVASTLMLSALALFLIFAGGTSFLAINSALQTTNADWLPKAAIALFVCGLFVKGGLVPFHGWVPDAYSAAPAPVSVLLAGIVTKASGIYALARLANVISFTVPLQQMMLLFGAVSIVFGALAALNQRDLKRLLAYSSISQVGYIVMAIATGTKFGLFAAMFHFFNHAVFKAQLFANAAALEEQLGTNDLEKMAGLGTKMPVTGLTALIASLSTAGLPPLAGFWSKLLIIVALWVAGYPLYALLAILASAITLAYFLLLQRSAFFGKPLAGASAVKEARAGLLVPAVLLAVITVVVGLGFPFVMTMFMR
ncbi:MAG TPA: proton-conducting transporter membrane subunit [Candidatus Sulfotelmatobacter sp.]|nr:proton-conducting transporter membrane subunit [Candidatus Sulfotelmatobacter sp.]